MLGLSPTKQRRLLRFLFLWGLFWGSLVSGNAVQPVFQSSPKQVSPWNTLEQIFSEKALTWESSAYLVLTSKGIMSETSSPLRCWDNLRRIGWVPSSQQDLSTRPISLSEYTFLLTQAFRWRGGWWYSWFPGAGTAFREFLWAGLLPKSSDPDASLTGAQAASLLRRVMAYGLNKALHE